MRWLELRVPPVALAVAFAVVMWATARVFLNAAAEFPASTSSAVALVVLGAAVAIAGVVAIRRQHTTINPFTPDKSSSLVVTGVYRFSRNPMYLGLLLVLAGWSLFLGNWVSMLMLPAFVVYIHRFQIRPEEKALRSAFGPRYDEYARVVRRWL